MVDGKDQTTNYSYAAGRLTEIHLPNGVAGAYSYNGAGRLVRLDYHQDTTLLASYTYTYRSIV